MNGPVDEDADEPGWQVIDQVGPGASGGHGGLGTVWESVSSFIEPLHKVAFERRVGKRVEQGAGFGAGATT